MAPRLTAARLLQSQGFGSRKACEALVQDGVVEVDGVLAEGDSVVVLREGLPFTVDGEAWTWREKVYLLLHKPAGYECSASPQHHRSVHELLPAPLVLRGVQPVGRLDQDTTGLLLLSDDGDFIHALTSPRRHVPKTYRVTTAEDVTAAVVEALRTGVRLDDAPEPVHAEAVEAAGARGLLLTITEGKYHQVKRMVAAAGGHVAALHRVRVGEYQLPEDLEPGQWRWVDRMTPA